MRIVTYLIKYLSEFEFIFETILDYESGDQMGSFDAKKPPLKISCLGTFKSKSLTCYSVSALCIITRVNQSEFVVQKRLTNGATEKWKSATSLAVGNSIRDAHT
jgi:hypothetical protein